ncbi:MAG: hypothetical protein ACI90V_007457, partial [Bacillariaceae sp.]
VTPTKRLDGNEEWPVIQFYTAAFIIYSSMMNNDGYNNNNG